jgi:hypothetical protein
LVVVVIGALVGAAGPGRATGQGKGGGSALMPPNSKAFGKSFEEWNVLYAQWAIEDGLGGGSDVPNPVGRVRFLPTNFEGPGSYEFRVTLRPGTPFVAPPFFVFGERYDDPTVPDDDPDHPILAEIFETTDVKLVLNGRVLMNDSAADLERFLFGPVYFDEPIEYAEPQPRGPGLNAVSALFVVGVGAVFHPLPVGRHKLEAITDSPFFGGGFRFTYHITVTPR